MRFLAKGGKLHECMLWTLHTPVWSPYAARVSLGACSDETGAVPVVA